MATTNASTAAGSTISIGLAPATYDLAGFAAVSYSEIKEVTDIPEFGKEYNLVTHNPVGNRATFKFKGSYNSGSLTLAMAKYEADAGQAMLATASDSDDDYSFKLVVPSGTTYYFPAKVMSFTTVVGSVDSIYAANAMLEISGDIVKA